MRNLTLALLLASLWPFLANGRTWTDRQGRTFDGDVIEVTGGEAKIRRSSDQRIFSIPVERLSDPDRDYLSVSTRLVLPETADDGASGAQKHRYKVEPFQIALGSDKPEPVRLQIKYKGRVVWEGIADVPGTVDLTVSTDTDFLEEPRAGRIANEPIYLFIDSQNHAAQWHVLQKSGDRLVFRDQKDIRLYRQKFAIVEYAFFQGDDPNFAGREPTYSGVAAVGHWGKIPGFAHDWQIWQGSARGGLWGNDLLLEHHRGTNENGMRRVTSEPFNRMVQAPQSGYRHFGACGEPSQAAKAGETYYCRVVGHSDSTRGYGKILIQSIVDTVPEGIPVFER